MAQNLVPNPDFEVYTECPENLTHIEKAIPWVNGNGGTADYFHICSTGNAGVPDNFPGNQWPVSGVAYAGAIARLVDGQREYIRAPLDTALTAGRAYLVSFYVSVAENWCSTTAFGALFTVDTPYYDDFFVLPYTPQIEVNGEFIGNYNDWTEISRCFVAEGGERYITIGNFRDNSECPPQPGCGAFGTGAYFYIDLVSVVEMPLSESSFIMDPIMACDSAVIDPGPADAYHWEDGTTTPTHTVTQSGTYYVTISNECAFQYGEVEVTIVPSSPPVVLPADTMLCAGETLEISLDPDAGDYQWQDGSTASDYTISGEGMYTVILDDSCDVTLDTINVMYMDPPDFSLGQDTLICNGDAFTISLDSSLGDFTWQDGSNLPSYTIDSSGTYALTVTNMCGQAEDEIQIDFVDTIVFSIGPDQMTLCEGDIIEITLDPDLGDFLWQDGSTENAFTIAGAGDYSVTVTNACYSVSDAMLVSVLPPPEFTLGPDLTVCPGELPVTLNLSDVDYAQAWEWSDGSTMSIQQISAPGTYSVTVSNECFAQSDTIQIVVENTDPVVTLPPDQILCPGQSLVLDAGGVLGDYLWQDSTTADTFFVTEAGVYSLTVTNACGSGADTVIIDYAQALTPPDLGPDFSLCPGESGVLYANIDGVSYLWEDISTGSTSDADSLVVIGPGTYTLQVSDACSSAADTIIITSDATPPDVDLPNSIDLCEGDTVILDAGITGVEYLWTDPAGGVSTGSTTAASSPGTYTLTVSNACGTDSDTTIIVDAGPAPSVDLGADVGICEGDTIVLVPEYSDVESWLWNASTGSASTDSVFLVDTAGTIIVSASNQCGQVSDTLVVSLLPDVSTLDLGPDIALCPGESQTLSINAPDADILWSDGSTDTSYQVTSGGLVYVTISNACGESSDTVQVEILDSIPELNLGNDQSLCPGETLTIDPGISGVSYLWQDGSTASTFQANNPGWIVLTISNDCGSSTDSLEIIADTNGPQVDLGDDILACEGDTVVLQAGISGVEYLWQDGSTQPELTVTSSGVYSLTVSNPCGMDVDTVQILVQGTEPTPSLGVDTTLCDGEVLQLNANADSSTSILWQDGSTAKQYVVSESGTYILSETNHCGSAADTIIIDFESAPPVFDLGEDRIICPGDTVVLTAPQTDADITWQDGSHGASFIAFDEQTYTLELSNDCGVTSDEITISFDENEPQVTLDALSLCEGESITLEATQPFDAVYSWNTGSTAPAIQVSAPGNYFVSVMTDCYSTEGNVQITRADDCNPNIYIPNVFSPNGDGINDTWEVLIDPSLKISGIQCRVFDRWGDLVFEAKSLPVVWDGVFSGKQMAQGVYVYFLKYQETNQETRTASGDITLIR